jgi:hypothetical protein
MRFSKFQNDYSSLKTECYTVYIIWFLAEMLSLCLKMQAATLLCLRRFIGGFQIKRHKIMRIGHECRISKKAAYKYAAFLFILMHVASMLGHALKKAMIIL